MAQHEAIGRQRNFLPSLDGMRGFGVLLVFFAHYFRPSEFPFQNHAWSYPLFLVRQSAWMAVPMFFVFSGFLICGILIDTREREGYFKVFYVRRILRIFPPYYLTLLGVALFFFLNGKKLGHIFWIHFLYIQNLLPGYQSGSWPGGDQVGHLWSMAVEEQFYLIWPLVVWFCPNRRVLLRVTMLLIGICCILRFASNGLGLSASFLYVGTPVRADALLLGAVLAVVRREHIGIYQRLEPYAKYIAIAGIAAVMLVAAVTGTAMPASPMRAAILIPVVNIASVATIVAGMQEGTVLFRICSRKWISAIGIRCYAIYLFHFTYRDWFLDTFAQRFIGRMPRSLAYLLTIGIALVLTFALAELSFRLLEQPAMRIKDRLRLGPARKPHAPAVRPQQAPALFESDS